MGTPWMGTGKARVVKLSKRRRLQIAVDKKQSLECSIIMREMTQEIFHGIRIHVKHPLRSQ